MCNPRTRDTTSGSTPHPNNKNAHPTLAAGLSDFLILGGVTHPSHNGHLTSEALTHPKRAADLTSGAITHPNKTADLTSVKVLHPNQTADLTGERTAHPIQTADLVRGAVSFLKKTADQRAHKGLKPSQLKKYQ